MVSARRLAAVLIALGPASCLPRFDLTDPGVGDAAGGSGGGIAGGGGVAGAGGGVAGSAGAAVDSGGAAGATADAGVDANESGAPLCPDGPYGQAQLYFGAVEPEPAFEFGSPPSDPGENVEVGWGYLSPDGLRFVQERGSVTDTQGCGGTCFKSRELARFSWSDAWSDPSVSSSSYIQSFWAHRPHPFLNNLGLFACHGGGNHCVFYARNASSEKWPFGYGGDPDHFEYYKAPPFQGSAANTAFTPTPDGRTIAFASNRLSPTDSTASQPSSASFEIWTAESVDVTPPVDPTANYQNLTKHPAAGSDGFADYPEWLADDGLTLVITSRDPSDSSVDVYVVSRTKTSDLFANRQKIALLSDAALDESAFTLPSLAALAAHGKRGMGHVRRALTPSNVKYFRFAVCVGAPNP